MTKSKVLVIGLDGATFDWLGPWAAQGELPHLAQLLSEGVHAKLESTLPYVSPPAWASFLTGMNPGKHSVFSFLEAGARMQNPYGQELPVVNSTSIRAPTLWQRVNAQGLRVGFLNVPITWPPQAVDGFMISDSIFTPGEDSDYACPPDLKAELLSAVPEYKVRPYTLHGHSPKYIKEATCYTKQQAEAALWLMERFSWDLFMVVFGSVDVMQHAFWKYLDPGNPAYRSPKSENYRRLLRTFYQTIDASIERLVAHAGSGTYVLLMSDHGFTSGYRRFYPNRWLNDLGLLKFRKGLTEERVLCQLKRLDVFGLRKHLTGRTGFAIRDRVKRAMHSVGPAIDWAGTSAYAIGEQEPFVYVNLKGRQPMGVVAPGEEYEALRDCLIAELLSLRDPRTGELVIGDVYRREELYDGPYLEQAPDLIYDFRVPGYTNSQGVGTADLFDNSAQDAGIHHRQGIFLARGPSIKRGLDIGQVSILDLAPTLLYLLGPDVPKSMDGRVLTEILDEAFVATHPVRYTTPMSEGVSLAEEKTTYSPDELEEVRTRLRHLGYL